MTTLNEINKVKAMQLTIDKLLEQGAFALKTGSCSTGLSNKWVLEPIYDGPDCSIGFVHIAKVEIGPCENHMHSKSREYLIVVEGSILLNVDGRDVRVVHTGECAAIEAGTLHYSKPLSDNTKLVYVCVPKDYDIPAILKNMEIK